MDCPRITKGRKKCCPIPGSPCAALQTLRDVVRCYIRCCRPAAQEELADFRSPTAFHEAIRMAGLARDKNNNKLGHQWRIPNTALRKSARGLHDCLDNIRGSSNFEDLHGFVHRAISPIEGIGPLTIYDTALRIGANLQLRPARVYLHAGTTEGAKALGLKRGQEWLDPSELPKEFSLLSPDEVEDLLCIYKEDLRRLTRRHDYGTQI